MPSGRGAECRIVRAGDPKNVAFCTGFSASETRADWLNSQQETPKLVLNLICLGSRSEAVGSCYRARTYHTTMEELDHLFI